MYSRNINCQQAGTLQTKQSKQQPTHVPKQMVQLANKASASHLHLFKSHNQSFPQTQKTRVLNFQGQLFISNE